MEWLRRMASLAMASLIWHCAEEMLDRSRLKIPRKRGEMRDGKRLRIHPGRIQSATCLKL